MKKNSLLLVFIVLSIVLQGCVYTTLDSRLVSRNHIAGSTLVKQLEGSLDDRAILAASFVNIDDLKDTSTFGRVASQQIATQFTRAGYKVKEMLLRKNVIIKQKTGEFLLSRELKEISVKHNAQAVIVGTYALASNYVYLTAKLVNTVDSTVLSSYDYRIPVDRDVKKLFGIKEKQKIKPNHYQF